jgi:ATP-binding cassette subfamily A (ABC1) protein 3
MQVAGYIKGGWIQNFRQSAYRFPDAERELADAIKAAGPTLGPVLLSMSEFLMSSFNESYQSRCVDLNSEFLFTLLNSFLNCI